MSQIHYHLTDPESTSATGYVPFQTVDFNLNVPGRKLLPNSIRIEGRVVARTNTTDPWQPGVAGGVTSAIDADTNVKVDNVVGAHAFFDSWSCETQKSEFKTFG